MDDLEDLLSELRSGDDARAESSLPSFAELGEIALPPLLRQLNSESADERWWAAGALSLIHHPNASEGLIQALKDSDPSVRQCAAFGLRQQPNPEAIPTLIHALGDSDRLLARLASDALAALRERATSPLTQALRSPDARVRIGAARALANLDDLSTIAPLFTALDDPSPMVSFWAEEGLQRLGLGMVYFEP